MYSDLKKFYALWSAKNCYSRYLLHSLGWWSFHTDISIEPKIFIFTYAQKPH